MPLTNDKYNSAVVRWGAGSVTRLRSTGVSMGITHRSNSSSKSDSLTQIKDKYKEDGAGFISRVTFSNVSRGLIYTTEGAGKGRGGAKGSRWVDKYGKAKKTNPESLGKAGSGERKKKPFISNFLDGADGVPLLADIVASHTGDTIIENVKVK